MLHLEQRNKVRGSRQKIVRIIVVLVLVIGSIPILYSQQRVNYLDQGRSELVSGHLAKALEKFNIVIQQRTDLYEAYYLRGYTKFKLDDYLGAEADFTRAIDLNPYWAQLFTIRGNTRDKLSDYKGAFSDYQKAIKIDSTDGSIYANRALTLLFLQQFEPCIADCNQAIRLHFETENIYTIKGQAELGLKNYRPAIHNFNEAISINRFSSYTYVQRALAYQGLNAIDSARNDLYKSLKLDSTSAFTYYQLSILEMDQKNDSLALKYINNSLRLSPYNTAALYNKSLLHNRLKDNSSAILDLSKLIQMAPSNFLAYFNRGNLYYTQKEYNSSLADYDKAIELAPENADAYFNRALVKDALHNNAGAYEDQKRGQFINERNKQLTDTAKYAEGIRMMKMMSEGSDFITKSESRESLQYKQVTVQFQAPFLIIPIEFKFRPKYFQAYSLKIKSKHHHDVVRLYNTCDTISTEVLNGVLKKTRINEKEKSAPVNYSSIALDQAAIECQLHHFNSAIEACNQSLLGDSTNPMTYFEAGNIQLQLVRFLKDLNGNSKNQEAIAIGLEKYNIAISLEPEFFVAYYNRALLKAEAEDYKGALQDFTLAIQINPNFQDAYFNRAVLYLLFKEHVAGCSDLSRAGELGLLDAYSLLKKYCN